MERSLHRVSLGSRRAHPHLSFYLTTFGKCLWVRLPSGLLSCQKGKRPPWQGDFEQVFFPFGTFSGLFLQAQQVNGHHLLPGRSCQLQLVLPHLAGIIMLQFIFQRPAL